MKTTFELTQETAKAEFELLNEMFNNYIENPVEFATNLVVKTQSGVFENRGCANVNDLWLYKKGSKGSTPKTFWRTSFGSKKVGFRVSPYGLRYASALRMNDNDLQNLANEIGAQLINDNGLTYFVKL